MTILVISGDDLMACARLAHRLSDLVFHPTTQESRTFMQEWWQNEGLVIVVVSMEEVMALRKRPFVRVGVILGEIGELARCLEVAEYLFLENGNTDAKLSIPALPKPTWDEYFMTLAEHAASRSNCMKRCVGAIIVDGHTMQVLSTGYNGTPRGTPNCDQGGCRRCNELQVTKGQDLGLCLCLHAEENAMLYLRLGPRPADSSLVLYCTMCPCFGCAKRAVQIGIKKVVFSEPYIEESVAYMKECGLHVQQHAHAQRTPIVIEI